MSSKVAPMIKIRRETNIGIVKLSNLKKNGMAKSIGMAIANPPSDGVIPSCKAF